MKVPKHARRLARRFYRGCFTNGVFEEAKARAVVTAVIQRKPRGYIAVLGVFARLVRLEVARHTATIESATELSETQRAAVQERLQRMYQRPVTAQYRVNPGLIGGMRVAVGSDVWDGTVLNRLESLRSAA